MTPFVVPDSATPSGGNVYDRRISDALGLTDIVVPGTWPRPGASDCARLAQALAELPDGTLVLLDGLVACGVPDAVVPHAGRLRLVVLVHLPLADETGVIDPAELDAAERTVLRAAHGVIATSPSAARQLIEHHGITDVHVVAPGVDPQPLASGTDGVSRLLCVASVTPRKGHDLLADALATVGASCRCIGPASNDPYVNRLRDRLQLIGPLTGDSLAHEYDAADLFVLPSRAETYGMVVTEALARGIPVIASAVPDALGDGGLLLPPGDGAALSTAIERWFTDPELREELRAKALRRRAELSTWDEAAEAMAEVLANLRA